jgi:glycosyltransferase involved in cell wall biosynthesis
MKQALYFYHSKTSFTEIDRNVLETKYLVKESPFIIKNGLSIPFLWIQQVVFLLRNIQRAEVILCMFAGYHSFLPVLFGKLFKKKVVIVAGGIDCVAFPSINYGNFNKKILGWITCWSFKNCYHIAPISEYLVDSPYTFQPYDHPRQGILFHCRKVRTPITVIYNGFNIDKWYYNNETRLPKSFLTIASNLDNNTRKKIKGVDLLIETARLLPDCSFTILGSNQNIQNLPRNIKLLPPVSHDLLRSIYCTHQFYLQLSISEGFGNTLAESMLCECVPIGSSAGAIPMIIENAGYILNKKNSLELKQLIEDALKNDQLNLLGKEARNRIIKNFSFERRKEGLLKLFEN